MKYLTDGLQTSLWIIVSILLFKFLGWVPVLFILIFHVINGVDEIFRCKR